MIRRDRLLALRLGSFCGLTVAEMGGHPW
jgi:hypothetical protein